MILQIYFGEGVCVMRFYAEPKLEIVTIKANDVITASGDFSGFFSLFRTSNIEDGGRASLNSFAIGSGN